MTRPDPSRASACLGAGLATTLVAATTVVGLSATTAPAEAAEQGGRAPLAVTMDTLRPAVLPRRGEVTVTGQVTNRSKSNWEDLQVYLLTSSSPIGDGADLVEAVASDPAADVGARLARPGQFDEIGDLAPGETTSYALTVDRDELEITGEPGVYWIGVHVLGAGDGVRDTVADGRARSFVPLMPRSAATTQIAITVPFRQPVRRGMDNRLLGLDRWQQRFADGGRLDRLLSFASSSTAPLTWVVDPAVLHAARSVGEENPALDTDPDGSGPVVEEEPGPSTGPSPAADEAGGSDPEEEVDEPTFEAQDATGWLARFRRAAARQEVRSVPYGDLDVAAVTHNRLGELVRRAQRLSAATMEETGVDASPVLAPPSGYLSGRAVSRLQPDAPVLMSRLAMPQADGPLLQRKNGVQVVLVDTGTSAGGPGPNDRTSPLALRQRILAEAAVRSLDGAADPVVVGLPQRWDPGADWLRADFFGGLDVPWLEQVGLETVLATGPGPRDTTLPVYPVAERRAQVPLANLVATRELITTGETYADLLTYNDTVDEQLARSAMLASSYAARRQPARALARARSTANQVRLTMSQVVVEGPPFVMLSSTTGPIAVTVVNNLTETVTVELEAVTGSDDLRISLPDPLTLEPGQRSPVRMRADAADIGVRSVILRPTTVEGVPLGSQVRFNVRASNVGLVIWFVMGGGAVLFVGAIALRIRRRVRARKATHGPLLEPTP